MSALFLLFPVGCFSILAKTDRQTDKQIGISVGIWQHGLVPLLDVCRGLSLCATAVVDITKTTWKIEAWLGFVLRQSSYNNVKLRMSD